MYAGGKVRKVQARKPPLKPYDRPPTNQTRRKTGGWLLSKIVDPAYRLIADGATKLLPSILFSSSSSSGVDDDDVDDDDELSSLPPLEVADSDERHPEAHTETRNDNQEQEVKTSFRAPKLQTVGQNSVAKWEASGSAENEFRKTNNPADEGELSKIEQLINGKNLSRDDITRLMEILQSKTVGFGQERKDSDLSRAVEGDMVEISPEKPRLSLSEAKREESNRVVLRSTDLLLQPSTQEAIGSSPVEIAKAYMNSRATDRGLRPEGFTHQENLFYRKDELAPMPSLPPRSPTPSICWPGALIQENTGYYTPRSQGGRSTLRSFPLTPYSRTPSLKSKSQLTPLHGASEKLPNDSSTPIWRAQTPIFGELKPELSEDRYGSAGPIRRTRNKLVSQSPARVSPFVRSVQQSPLHVKESSDLSGFLSKKTTEARTLSTYTSQSVGDKAGNSNLAPVHPHNSMVARHILEQISKPPSQKQKMEELRLTVSASKTFASSESDKQISSPHLWGLSNGNEGNRTAFFRVPSNVVSSTANDINSTPMTSVGNTSVPFSTTSLSADGSKKKSSDEATDKDARNLVHPVSSFGSQSEEQGATLKPSAPTVPKVLNMKRRPLHLVAKGSLPSISVNSTTSVSVIASDNGKGFTFPPSNLSNLSEPPTPTFLPSSVANALQPSTNSFTTPTFTFGDKKSSTPLVFSFPSTSAAASVYETADIKFKFGSDDERISFRLTGKDAVCC